ncbi:MAG: hypothetical protein Q4D45_01200 [Lachnospiraceae bacterium]|nr:hypothetical protein [Lachnospiraceae bacterium]
MYKKFEVWLDRIMEQQFPDDMIAICFNLYESSAGHYFIELVGTDHFDLEDTGWIYDEVFDTSRTLLNLEYDLEWEDMLEKVVSTVKEYLQYGTNATRLKAYQGIGAGFVEGDVEIIYSK